ncbi:hypothetical protein SADUNF_Sadunf14G0067100 [Salix dunnii]|uniref:DUF7722 domain-containing protein n=1 Tax=Salix dunnii TaxID=1413687 RepID=A0A835JGR9_9ROSI|nr:hypothetical protein SADUNF_Sadunf14G0067100 [Salix dunnii]
MNNATLPYIDDVVWVPHVPQSLNKTSIKATNILQLACIFSQVTLSDGGMESVVRPTSNTCSGPNGKHTRERCGNFQMPLHYPRYTRAEYETMPEWKLDCLLREYGLPTAGDTEQKRKYAMGAFLWPR